MIDFVALQSVTQAHASVAALRQRLVANSSSLNTSELAGALSDVTTMLDNLQVHFELLNQILETSTDAVFAKDLEGRYLMMNPAGADLFGRSVGEFLGHDDTAIFAPVLAQRLTQCDLEVLAAGRVRTTTKTYDVNGVDVPLLTTTTPWYGPTGALRGLIGTACDPAVRGANSDGARDRWLRLRALASEIVISEESLRRTLAAELHSGLEQELALAQMHLSALRERAEVDLHAPLAQIANLIERAERSLRAVSVRLSPPALHELGLVPALEWLADDMRERFGLDVQIENYATLGVASDALRVILFRAIRELLVNTAQHAGVKSASVRLDDHGGALCITVSDAGVGFDVPLLEGKGHGLFGIREQLEHLGGALHVDARPGHGTIAVLTTPMPLPGPRAI